MISWGPLQGEHCGAGPCVPLPEGAGACWLPKQVQCVMLVNCGAADDLAELMRLREDSETRVIVADSHRCARMQSGVALFMTCCLVLERAWAPAPGVTLGTLLVSGIVRDSWGLFA